MLLFNIMSKNYIYVGVYLTETQKDYIGMYGNASDLVRRLIDADIEKYNAAQQE